MQSLYFDQAFSAGAAFDSESLGLVSAQLSSGSPVSYILRPDAKPSVCPPPVTMKYIPSVPPPVTNIGSTAPPARKRKRGSRSGSDEISFVAIDRDLLLQMSLIELESTYHCVTVSDGLSTYPTKSRHSQLYRCRAKRNQTPAKIGEEQRIRSNFPYQEEAIRRGVEARERPPQRANQKAHPGKRTTQEPALASRKAA